jgi:glucose-1-phosphate cytidylyltransferase
VKGERFMLTYGDGLSNVDLGALLAFHERQGTVATVTGVRPPGRFGELVSSPDGRASEFNEKPQATGGLISGGFFVLEPSFFDHLDARDDLVLEEQPLRSLVAARQLSVFQHDGFWQCMDTHRDWTLLNQMAERENQPWKVW